MGLRAWTERRALQLTGLALLGALLLGQAPANLGQDAWLGLVGGRLVASEGIPRTDTLTVWSAGERWVDQQWLGQLALYGLHRAGGLALVVSAYVGLVVASLAMAMAAAHARGASDRNVLLLLTTTIVLVIAVAAAIRTQAFAYPLFSGVLWILVRAGERPTSAVLAVVPVLVLWANVHGTVLTGAGLVALYGLALLATRLRRGGPRRDVWLGVALCLAAPLTLLATPYGADGLAYYRDTVLDDEFRAAITEWQPVTTVMPVALVLAAVAAGCAWAVVRGRGRATAFDRLALLAMAVLAASAVRNVVWFGLAALVLVPSLLGETSTATSAPRRVRLNLTVVTAALTVLLVTAGVVATRPRSWFERRYDPQALEAVSALTLRDARARVFADVRYADWLMWHRPELVGRVAYDARLELLRAERLRQLVELRAVHGKTWAAPIEGFEVLVLDGDEGARATEALLRLPTITPVLRGRHGVVVARQVGRR